MRVAADVKVRVAGAEPVAAAAEQAGFAIIEISVAVRVPQLRRSDGVRGPSGVALAGAGAGMRTVCTMQTLKGTLHVQYERMQAGQLQPAFAISPPWRISAQMRLRFWKAGKKQAHSHPARTYMRGCENHPGMNEGACSACGQAGPGGTLAGMPRHSCGFAMALLSQTTGGWWHAQRAGCAAKWHEHAERSSQACRRAQSAAECKRACSVKSRLSTRQGRCRYECQ